MQERSSEAELRSATPIVRRFVGTVIVVQKTSTQIESAPTRKKKGEVCIELSLIHI